MLLAGCAGQAGTVAALQQTLSAQPSATRALEQWCAARRLSTYPVVTARRLTGSAAAEPPDLRQRLGVSGGERLGYRHVELSCGGRVLSVAHNWYVRSALTGAMNAELDTSDTPFGKVAAPLSFTRERIGERRGAASACPRTTVLSHRAMLRTAAGAPLALVVECYTREALRRGD